MLLRIKNVVLNLIKLPVLLLGYSILLLLSLLIPSKYISRVFNLINIEEDIAAIVSNKLNLKLFALILSIIVYTIYKIS